MPGTISALELIFPPRSVHPDLPDRVSLALDDLTPAAIHEIGDDEAPVWRVFLGAPGAVQEAARHLSETFAPDGLLVGTISVPDEDWAARTQAHLRRVTVGALTVAPPWDLPESDAGLIVIEPSTGFGTGHHETTRLCLALLQRTAVSGRRVIDAGTGSGVLAIAAARLGAAAVEAFDYDEDALANARENVARNGVADRVRLLRADLTNASLAPVDVVLANLTGALLINRAPALARLVAPGGTLMVSGCLAGEIGEVTQAFARSFDEVETLAEGEWHAARLVKRSDR